MTWTMEGTYFENCSCATICPCTWSNFAAKATNDRCQAMLAFHIDRGAIEGVEVGGLSFAMVVDSPPIMSDGGWKVGVVLDSAASEPQSTALGRVLSGELGGPPAMLGPLIGEMLGVEMAPAVWSASGSKFAVRFGDLIDVEVSSVFTEGSAQPVQLSNIFHPANSTLTVSPATKSKIDVFGISFDGTGTSGFNAPYAWSA